MIQPKIKNWLLKGYGQHLIRDECSKERIPLDNKVISEVINNLTEEEKCIWKQQKKIIRKKRTKNLILKIIN